MDMATPKRMNGNFIFDAAQRMAKHGHRNWIFWNDATGSHADEATEETIAEMFAAIGVHGPWTLLSASTGVPMKGYPWMAENVIANQGGAA